MRIPKRYGQSRVDNCPFCGKQGSQENKQGLTVCVDHKHTNLPDMKCLCGDYLDVRSGKYGAYANCANCGNMNMRKALEINEVTAPKKEVKKIVEKKPVEMVVRSDDPRYFD